jgi:selenide,water dikinase
MTTEIRLTQFSHGAGCGCKIAPSVLEKFLKTDFIAPQDDNLLVGNTTKDDAAVYNLGDGSGIISTTDFFMPIVDDAFEFGRVAAANAISDVYAMGGSPMMAIAILGWPVSKLGPEIAQQVLEGGRHACKDAGIHLAGGHSIDTQEPIFGLAVTGKVDLCNLKKNSTAQSGDHLFLTKPIGVGVLTTAEKQGKLKPQHSRLAVENMMALNSVGEILGTIPEVNAMTDVTGFGLLGHLIEMCQGSHLSATIDLAKIPVLDTSVTDYIAAGCVPGGSQRNWQSIAQNIGSLDDKHQALLCDPQTSGGLLVAVNPAAVERVIKLLRRANCYYESIGELKNYEKNQPTVEVLA